MSADAHYTYLIIVGAGTAGIPCAIAAADAGLSVTVLEKSDRIGGTLYLTGGHLSAAGTRRQRQCGIVDSPEEHFEDVMRIGGHDADPDLVRLAVREAPRTIDWLDDLGFPFDPETPAQPENHEPYSEPRTYWGKNRGRSILRTIRPLWDRHVTAGRIRPLLQHECTDLILQSGEVQGVKADSANGSVAVWGDATVLTTGGYGANPEFYKEVSPGSPPLITNAAETSTADGIQIAMQYGADFRNADLRVPTLGGIEIQPGSGRTDYTQRWAQVTPMADRDPYEIYVTADGNRFVAEDTSSFSELEEAVLEQTNGRFWVVFDERGLTTADPPLITNHERDEIRELAGNGEIAWQAEDIEGLAERAGLSPDGLIDTIEAYNKAVKSGDDPLGRSVLPAPIDTSPFYAVLTHDTTLSTHGGLRVDDSLRVLDSEDSPIPNLFAAGEALGAGALSGRDFAGGMLLTPALSFGRILGRRIADR